MTDLNAANVVASKGNFTDLVSANAINDEGWIAGFGFQGESPTVVRSFVLIPYSAYVSEEMCPPDLAKPSTTGPDGTVNVYDLLVILNNWGTDGLGAELAEDDEVVDVDDLQVVVDSWGGCVGGMALGTPTLEEVLDGVGLDSTDWDDFIDVLTNSEDEEEIENYICWMKNYLSGCTTCPPCDAKDPFEDE